MSAEKLTSAKKLELLKKVLDKKASVTAVCKKAGISRKTFYQWLRKYKERPEKGHYALKARRPKGSKHWRSISKEYQKLILEIVRKHPEYSVGKISQELPKTKVGKPIISYFCVQRFLEKRQLNICEKRKEFAQSHRLIKRLSASKRFSAIERVLQGEQVVKVCQEYDFSRKTFYKWLKRYLASTPERVIENLADQNPNGLKHWKAIPQEVKDQIIDTVGQYPELSIHKLFAFLPKAEGRPLIGYYGLQKVLEKEGLNTLEKRLEFVQRKQAEIAPQFVPAPPPEIAPKKLRFLLAPFVTIPKWIARTPVSWPVALPVLLLLAYILEFDKFFRPAMFFPTIALAFGLFFFLYSLKYYLSLVMVLTFPSQGEGAQNEKEGQDRKVGRIGSVFAKIFGPAQSKALAMQENLDQVKLERYPFVSIHLPFYNERRVAERILKAATSLEYPNFEVIVLDDSTDETTEICQEYARKDQRIRLIHRDVRTGFKGAALQLALQQMNPKTEYVCIFDADFIPFPDTLEQFVKTFQTIAGGLDQVTSSNVAVVQGYQWHVLNKSENWITRGVRTEYAGSYVVERAGIELYGGLKMIAGSVFCIRADVIRQFGWGTSITEDFQLTLRLYEAGFKVAYTPYIQTPSECVSTIRRLIRQRMRWAEGHTFNVRRMWQKLFATPKMTGREKFEFLYLGPYYLQAAFFLIGTVAWFFSEVVVKARLPFWTAAFGWSLVFANFLSLPLMNLVGLFLEESEQRDYLGIASFILLSYIVVPFQAYAATKALFEKEEGPWFRTPKTGIITDAIGRARFYRWFEKLKIWPSPKPATASVGTVQAFSPAFSLVVSQDRSREEVLVPNLSSFNFLSGYKIRPKRIPLVARSAIAALLVVVLMINYLAFFPPIQKAQATGTPKIEQQINIMDQEYSIASASFNPTDNSLGIIHWKSTKFSNISAVYFEALIKNSTAGSTTTAALFTSSGTEISGSGCEVTTTSATYDAPKRATTSLTSCTNYVDDTDYSVRIKASANTAYIEAARLIILQVGGSNQSITTTQTQVDIGNYQTVYSVIYSDISNPKYYCYNGSIPSPSASSICSSASPTLWNPTPSVSFEATLKAWGIVGSYPHMSCGDGPTKCRIAYYDSGNSSLMFVACGDATCSVANLHKNVLDGAPGCVLSDCVTTIDAGTSNSIYCIYSNDCNISYYDATNYHLKFAHCLDDYCSTGSAETVDSAALVGAYTSVDCHVGEGYCAIAYYDSNNTSLKLLKCQGSTDCTNNIKFVADGAANCTFTNCDTAGNDGYFPSIYTGIYNSSLAVVIAYQDVGNSDLKFATCISTAGGQWNDCLTTNVALVESAGTVGFGISMYCTYTSTCKIVHYDSANGDLRFMACGNFNCNSGNTANLLDGQAGCTLNNAGGDGCSTGNVGSTSSIFCPTESTCKISYYDVGNGDLRYGACADANCGTGGYTKTVESTNDVGSYSSIDCSGGAADCKIAHYDATIANGDLRFYDCANANVCVTGTATLVDSGTGTAYAALYTTGGSQITTVSTSNTNLTRVVSSPITLTAGTTYKAEVEVNGAGTFDGARLVFDQSASTGINALETVQEYNNRSLTTTGAYASLNFPNTHTGGNFSGTVTKAFESILNGTTSKSDGTSTAEAKLSDGTGEVTTSNTTATRMRSPAITPADGVKDTQLACVSTNTCPTDGNYAYDYSSWLIIQMQSIPVPEVAIFVLPGMIFLPRLVCWWRRRLARRNQLVLINE